MKKKILWQKWINPFEPLTDEPISLDNINQDIFNEEALDSSWDSYSDIEEENREENSNNYQKLNSKAVITPMGIIPLNENVACTKTFKFWIGHTNFDLSQKAKEIIEKTEGVETLDIFTRYRFRIAVGKAFQDRVVMQNIQSILYEK